MAKKKSKSRKEEDAFLNEVLECILIQHNGDFEKVKVTRRMAYRVYRAMTYPLDSMVARGAII